MATLLRNPLLGAVLQLWWAPALFWVAGLLGFGGPVTGSVAAAIWVAYLCAVGGTLLGAWVHGASAVAAERKRHDAAGHTFLCGQCLHFGAMRYACGECGGEVPAFLALRAGSFVTTCGHCAAPIGVPKAKPVQAYCGHCARACDRSIYHERRVRALGVFGAAEFDRLADALGGERVDASGLRIAWSDDGFRLTLLLGIDDLTYVVGTTDDTHVLRHLEAVWIGEPDPLLLGRSVDGYIRRTGLSPQQLAAMPLSAPGPPDAAAERLLQARFGHGTGIASPHDFLSIASAPEIVVADEAPAAPLVQQAGPG